MKWVVCTTCCHVCKVVSIPKVAMMPGVVQTTPSFSYDSNDLSSILYLPSFFPLASSLFPPPWIGILPAQAAVCLLDEEGLVRALNTIPKCDPRLPAQGRQT
jgi:hypothetical protein